MCSLRWVTMNVLILYWACALSACGLVEFVRCAPDGEDSKFVGQLETCFTNDGDGFKADSVTHPVYCFPNKETRRPPILLLHEVPGLSGKTLEYARELSQDFTVYVPLLFGNPNSQSNWHGFLIAFGLNGEWRGLESGTSDVVTWLRAVVMKIEEAHPGQQIGVIGNCLTGSLPLALLDNPRIHAVVLAQPTLPLSIFRNDEEVGASLGISEGEIERAKNESTAKIFYLRFDQDCVSKAEKLKSVEDKFPGRVYRLVIPHSEHPVENAHSTLIGEWRVGESGNVTNEAQEEVTRFLRDPVNFRFKNDR
jgi:dienelactone hydrolase